MRMGNWKMSLILTCIWLTIAIINTVKTCINFNGWVLTVTILSYILFVLYLIDFIFDLKNR